MHFASAYCTAGKETAPDLHVDKSQFCMSFVKNYDCANGKWTTLNNGILGDEVETWRNEKEFAKHG
jgi:hypothetical protein